MVLPTSVDLKGKVAEAQQEAENSVPSALNPYDLWRQARTVPTVN